MKLHYVIDGEQHSPYVHVSEVNAQPNGNSFNAAMKQLYEQEQAEKALRDELGEALYKEEKEKGPVKNPKGSWLAFMYGNEEKYTHHSPVVALNQQEDD